MNIDGVLLWMLGNAKDVCSGDQPDNFTCSQGRLNYNSAVFWGGMLLPGYVNFSGSANTNTRHSNWTCKTV